MDLMFIIFFVGFLVFMLCMCCRSKRTKPMFSAPVVVTTTAYTQPMPGGGAHIVNNVPVMSSAQAMGHTGPNIVQHTHYQSSIAAYPTQMPQPYPAQAAGFGGYPMPQPAQPGYPPVVQQLAFPMPMPRPMDNPPSYDQVAVSDAYQKQQPYNPNFQS